MVVLAHFSKLKIVQAPNFTEFRKHFCAKPGRSFFVPANTYDNVKGQFPIGFFVWHTAKNILLEEIHFDVYDSNGVFLGKKKISTYLNETNVIEWLRKFYDKKGERIGYLRMNGTNVQNNLGIYVASVLSNNDIHNHFYAEITKSNVLPMCVYLAIRQCVEATWQNDREQYLVPKKGWESDNYFISNCLIYTLFHGQNRISNNYGTNHWIPFSEDEVNAKEKFDSHFMNDLIKGKLKRGGMTAEEREAYERDGKNYHQANIFELVSSDNVLIKSEPLIFSPEAQAVLDAGRELWRYYHLQPNANPNASFYDIRLYFQGTKTTNSGKVQMNTDSNDETYTQLITFLRQKQKKLAKIIEAKVYEFGFLKT